MEEVQKMEIKESNQLKTRYSKDDSDDEFVVDSYNYHKTRAANT